MRKLANKSHICRCFPESLVVENDKNVGAGNEKNLFQRKMEIS